MRRREFIGLLGGAAAWPLAARAQQGERVRMVGVVAGFAEAELVPLSKAFRDRLNELGWTEGRNLSIEVRLGRGDFKRMTDDAGQLIGLKPDVILAQGTPGLTAVREHSRIVPVVFVLVADPVRMGLIESLARPGGNATGLTNFEFTIGGKWLELLREASPRVAHVTYVSNPANPNADQFSRFIESSARAAGLDIVIASVRNPAEIALAITNAGRRADAGLVVAPDSVTAIHRDLIIGLASHYRLPAIYPFRIFPTDGGLISYGLDFVEIYRQAAVSLLARADEVIE